MSVDNSSLRAGMEDSFSVSIDFRYNLSVRDPRIKTEFDRPRSTFNGSVSVEGVDDALLVLETAGKRFNSYNRCPNPQLETAATGSVSEYNYTENGSERNWVSGDSRWFNGSDLGSVDSPSEKILFTPALCDYSFGRLEQFAGVVSDEETTGDDVCGSGEELPAYIGGVNTSRFGNGTRIVMNEDDVWRNFVPDQIDSRCYFPDGDGPTFFGRMEGNLSGDGNGLASFLDVPELPSEVQEQNRSAVDYVYFDSPGSSGQTRRIKGVTDHRDWFRLDEEHVSQWGAAALVY